MTTSAVTPQVDSASTTKSETPAFDATKQATWSKDQLDHWNRTGEQPKPEKQDSAPADKKSAAPDSAPDKDKKSAVSASESATDKDTQPHRKTKEDTERRIQELLDRAKKAEERAEALERRTQPEKREQGSKEELKAPPALKPFLEDYFKKNTGKSYEEGVEAWQDARDAYKDQENAKKLAQAIAGDRQRVQQEAAARELQTKVEDARQRYGKEEADRIFPALEKVFSDKEVPLAVKAILNDSDVLVDLLYTLRQDEAEFDKFVALAKSNPGQAIRQLVTTEALVRETLKKGTSSVKSEADKSATEEPKKPAAEEPKPRAPKPVSEVGGRGAAPEDAAKAAAKSGNFKAFSEEMTRRYKQA